jgi:hypothetical protein
VRACVHASIGSTHSCSHHYKQDSNSSSTVAAPATADAQAGKQKSDKERIRDLQTSLILIRKVIDWEDPDLD